MTAHPAMGEIGMLSRFFREHSSISFRSFAVGVLASAGWHLANEDFQNIGSTGRLLIVTECPHPAGQ